jgi:DNA-binding phage protein
MPLIDIAEAIKVERTTLFQLVKRNPKVFEGWVRLVDVTSTNPRPKGGRPDLLCATREWLIGILVKVSCDRVKDPIAQERIIAFQRWAIKTLTAVMEGRLPEQPFDFVDILSLPGGRVRAQALRRIAQERGLSRSAIYKYLQHARAAAGLPATTRRRRSVCSALSHHERLQLQAFVYASKRAGVPPTKSRLRAFMRQTGINCSISTAYRCTAEARGAKPAPRIRLALAVQRLFDPALAPTGGEGFTPNPAA